MHKSKTNKSAAKRFSYTASGRIKRRKASKNHLLTGKRRKRKRSLRRPALVHITDFRRIKRMLPNG